ncbi:hypothetical protein SPRG_18883 [Saprolegnia parasitica CBS 223.65]|uniref:B box-type domain-containing protein n=1 Tax=Saprolegnia parasitica (strain CBS 223.65) TaxID=695850 RepID=A0A067D9S4_SAPPC|nr:hypothetical protein SPRG_18883 [Saprolegnia parasitica CBS 223.65]KDO35737.1 hypothetical protein SPRG_18883 [Saprolegnia parasitica CBS 223.65]|eukprot:XP_012194097.1 hypothetical protein SPRG_18883 [Saprolegnia parasitica CBS 223.65]
MIGAVARGAACCRCPSGAAVACADCDLVYCADCAEARHRKGSFQRHNVTSLLNAPTCDECTAAPATTACPACELQYCDPCAKDVHRNGKLQAHLELLTPCSKEAGNQSPVMLSPPPPPFLSPFSAASSSTDSPFMQQRKRWSMSSDSMTGDDTDPDVDPWTNWRVFGNNDPRLSDTTPLPAATWTNPASDAMSTSSDEDAKPSSISDAFKTLALTHSSSSLSSVSDEPEKPMRSRLVSWETANGTYSQNELEDLFSALTSRSPTRHVSVRSSGPFSTTQCASVYQTMQSHGDVANCNTAMATHGVLLYTFYELKSATQAVNKASPMYVVDYCVLYDHPTPKTHATVEIAFAPGYDRGVVSSEELHLICSTLGDVVTVTEPSRGHFLVEFNDARVVVRAVGLLSEKGNLGGHVFTAVRAPASPSELKAIGHCQLASQRHVPAVANPAHSPEKVVFAATGSMPIPSRNHQLVGIWADPPMPPPSPPTDEFSLGIDRVYAGTDKRTTLMIRNIPNKYTQAMLLAEINARHAGTYDFFYLPIDFKNKCNMGYAFVNFMETATIGPFYEAFNGQRWPNFNSDKVCAISYARLQGKAAMIARFQNSSLLEKHESYRPLVFKSSGPNKGALEPFPSSGKARVFKPPYPPMQMHHHHPHGDATVYYHQSGYHHPHPYPVMYHRAHEYKPPEYS